MASTYYFVEDPRERASAVLTWFRGLESPPVEVASAGNFWLQFGPLAYSPDGDVDVKQCPLVSLFPARTMCGALWTVTEIHFLAKGSSAGGKLLAGVQRKFRKWLALHEIVFEQFPAPESPFSYYLEGGIQSVAPVVYAPPSGVAALRRGQYVVPHSDDERRLERLCRTLRLRGVDCNCAQQPV